ncbi:MAG: caspase family protein [Lewinellaceae bacterium]|nr:caspase family protein [Lewinellaceae bacterium]
MYLLLFFAFLNTFLPYPKPPLKIALLVTISHYQEGSDWTPLHADNDASLLEHALLRQGFQNENIIQLRDGEATREGILRAIENQLVKKARKGGLAVFHFSGHGQQVRDDNGDELDGYDEAIVPYDSPLHFRDGIYEGENLIRDEELGQLLEQVRRKLGKHGHLLTILDSCHSGTGTRGMGTARGTDVIMADSAYIAGHLEEEPLSSTLLENVRSDSRLAPEVAFFGSSARQLNYEMPSPEGKMVGSLTYSFCQALEDLPSGASYESLFDQVRLLMGKWVPRQQPQAEGPLNLPVLGGRALAKKNYFRIPPDGLLGESAATLPGGKLHGLFPGTKVGFYPPNTYDWKQATPYRTGRITNADLLESEVQLDEPANPDSLLATWAYISEYRYGELQVPVQMQLPNELQSAIRKEGEAFPLLQFVKAGGELSIQQAGDTLQVIARDGKVLFEKPANTRTEVFSSQVIRYLLQYAQTQFLRTLEMEDPDRKVRAVLIPIQTKDTPERGVCRVGDTYRLEIRNEGQSPAYYSILDIQPDYQVNVLVPAPGSRRTPEEYYIGPGESQQYEVPFAIYPPTGLEVLKVIATDRALDLRSIVANRGQSSANQHTFEQLLATTYWFENRGGNTLTLLPELNIETLVFKISE